jgi:hypothetical protein
MNFRKITLEVVVAEDDSETFTQALNDAMDRIEERQTIYSSEIREVETGEPDNAAEISGVAIVEANEPIPVEK